MSLLSTLRGSDGIRLLEQWVGPPEGGMAFGNRNKPLPVCTASCHFIFRSIYT